MDIVTNLRYKRKDLLKAIDEIWEIAEKSDLFAPKEWYRYDELDVENGKTIIASDITLKPKKRIAKKLNKIFGEEYEDWIKYKWRREEGITKKWTGYWRLAIHGRALCYEGLKDVLGGSEDYSSCLCPKEFKDFCRKTTSVLKQYFSTQSD